MQVLKSTKRQLLIVGRFKSLANARLALSRLQAVPGTKSVKIVARRGRSGRYSNRGTYFTFDIRRGLAEYVIRISYESKKHGHNLLIEVHLIGPQKASRETIEDVWARFQDGDDSPGWSIRVVTWGPNEEKRNSSIRGGEQEALETFAAAIEAGTAQIISKGLRDRSTEGELLE